MTVNYKTFSKHAEKMVKGFVKYANRPILRGINHDDKGTLVVTDTHRLYRAKNVNAPKNVVLDAITGEEITSGTYPNVDRLIPNKDEALAVMSVDDHTNVNELITIVKAMQMAGSYNGTKKKDVKIAIRNGYIAVDDESLSFSFKIKSKDTENSNKEDGINVLLSSQFLLEALELFSDAKYNQVDIYLFGNYKPLLIEPVNADDLNAIIMPMRDF